MLKEVVNNNKDKIVVLDFYADWCGPCKMIKPLLKEIHEENENIHVEFFNGGDNMDVTTSYDVMAFPTLIIYKEGKEVKRLNGFLPKPQLLNAILEA